LEKQFNGVFDGLSSQLEFIEKVIKEEEASFLNTLGTGLKKFAQIEAGDTNKTIDGKDAFELYDTFGFPIDLTRLMATEKGLEIDESGFDEELQKQKSRSRKAAAVSQDDWVYLTDDQDEEFVGYDQTSAEVKLARYRRVKNKDGEQYQLVFNFTPFYAEGGGQVGDTGYIASGADKIRILDTKKENNLIVHYADRLPSNTEATFTATVDTNKRTLTTYNHSATHLLHEALRSVLGTHVQQKGSLVNESYLRFDFSHFAKLTDDELTKIEDIVNDKIRANDPLEEKRAVPIGEAKAMGAMALFGEKYGDLVRVIKFGTSVELCGGIHVPATGNIGLFKVVSESAVAAGIRRIEAYTGPTALHYLNDKLQQLEQVATVTRNSKDIVKGVQTLVDENHQLKKELEKLTLQQAGQIKDILKNSAQAINGVQFIAAVVDLNSADAIKGLAYQLKNEVPNLFLVLGAEMDGKASLTIMIDEELAKAKNLNAGSLIREWAKAIEGGGGGQAFYATAGGKKPSGLNPALDLAKEFVGKL
jgi:alanyl-tRNA synthetase